MSAPELNDAEQTLALGYATKSVRPTLSALWQLDESLGRIVATTTEPMIGQMRLTWWHERLCALDAGNCAAEPLLRKMAVDVLPHDVKGADLATLIEGWEALLEPLPLCEATLTTYAENRGATLFKISARLLGRDASGPAGEGWALMDFALKCSDPVTAERAVAMAQEKLSRISPMPRPLRILARLAQAKALRFRQMAPNSLPRFVFLRAVLG
jgi:phytoene synthase